MTCSITFHSPNISEADAVPGAYPGEEKDLREVKSRVVVRT